MIALFRRYQRAIYFVVTTIIVFSFSFFGTYAANTRGTGAKDEVAATLVNGDKVYQSQLSRYVQFLSSDPLLSPDGSGNPLNSGFLADDFLSTPVAPLLAEKCGKKCEKELLEKLNKEKRFTPYQHPQAPFLSAMNVWSYFSPEVRDSLLSYQKIDTTIPVQDVLKAKINLFRAERAFPSIYLKQILLYQQKQYSWLEPDITLEGRPLSLFGYTNLEDWFGPSFTKNAVIAVMNIARIAENEGLTVSYDEAKAFLYNTARKYVEQVTHGRDRSISVDSVISQSLVAYGIDEHEAVSLIRDTLLFKRALNEIPSHVIAAQKPFDSFLRFASQDVQLTTYALPSYLSAQSLRDLVKIQTWINAVAPKEALGDSGLQLPKDFYSAQEVIKAYPELVQKRFLVSITSLTEDDLLSHVRLKDIWSWLEDDQNWSFITKKYPILLEYAAETPAHRVRIIESLSGEARKEVDVAIRQAIISGKREWIQDLLSKKSPSTQTLVVRMKGSQDPLPGISNRLEFSRMLSEAVIGDKIDALSQYTQDGKNYFSIVVLDRSKDLEIVPLKTALQDGTLDSIVDSSLEAAYSKLKADKVRAFQKEDNSTYRDFQEIKDALLERVWSGFILQLKKLEQDLRAKQPEFFAVHLASGSDTGSEKEIGQKGPLWAKIRFLPYLTSLYERLKDGDDLSHSISSDLDSSQEDTDLENAGFDSDLLPLNTTWAVVTTKRSFSRGELLNGALPNQFEKLFLDNQGNQQEKFLPPVVLPKEGALLFGLVEKYGERPFGGKSFEFAKAISDFIGEEAMMKRSVALINSISDKGSFVIHDASQEVAQ